MHILIADDHDDCRFLIRNALRPVIAGSEFLMTEDGAHAWWALTEPQAKIDLCIIDINMPRVGGLTLLQRIRAHEQLSHLPVIMCTALSDRHSVATAAHLKISGYIAKPYSIDMLQSRVLSIIASLPSGLPSPA